MSDDMNRQIASEPDEFAGHTPEPWTVFTTWSQQTGSGFAIEEQRGDESSQEAEANARLIAAAPRLLRENRDLRAEVARLRADFDAAKLRCGKYVLDLAKAEAAMRAVEAERDALKAERDALAETAARLRAALDALRRSSYHWPVDKATRDLVGNALILPVSPAEAAAAERLKGGAR